MVKIQKKHPIWITVWVSAIATVGILSTSGCLEGTSDASLKKEIIRPVKVMKILQEKNAREFTFPATADSVREVKLSFRVNGPLVRLDMETGQEVEKGQLVAAIDSRDFTIAVKTLEARLASSRARLQEASLQYERYTNLIAHDAAAQAKYDTARAAFQMAQAQVKADAEGLKNAKNALKDTKLIAPFTGYTHHLFVENYETVTAGQPIISLVDVSTLEAELGLPENLLGRVPEFTDYKVVFDAVPDKVFSAKFKELGKKPNPASRSYPMTLVIEKTAGQWVRPGMTAQVRISLPTQNNKPQFIIPIQALFNRGEENSSVWVFEPEKSMVRQQMLTVVRLEAQGAQVVGKSLSDGQWIVVSGVHHLKEGQKVRRLVPPSETNVGGML